MPFGHSQCAAANCQRIPSRLLLAPLLAWLQGWQQGGRTGLAVGFAKGLVGLPCRPMVGGMEATRKVLHSLAMATLGREGILGKMQVGRS